MLDTRRMSLWAGALLVLVSVAWPCAAAKRSDGRDQWQQPERVVADLHLADGSVVADIGAGRGYFTFRLARAVGPKGKVCATDISDKALKALADKAKKDKVENIETVLSDATETKLKPDSLDAAMICLVLHHVPKEQRLPLTKDVARALKPGGYYYIVDWRMDAKIKHDLNNRIPKADLVQLAADAGLTLDAEFHYLENQVFLRFRKPAQ
ncbi:MAG TPA: class I SAM-dependent methyltransferase [Phycisphaerae bacterium]|nr:class I SAM-dependent methyltransferase [Phycisphaerae bacterium]